MLSYFIKVELPVESDLITHLEGEYNVNIDDNDIPATVPVVKLVDLNTTPITTRSGRLIGPPSKLMDYVVYGAMSKIDQYNPSTEYLHPIAYAVPSDPDVLYYHDAMVAHNRDNFLKAMEQELKAQTDNGNWIIVKRSDLPDMYRVLLSVWARKRKCLVLDGMIYKWKARLNIDGGKQVQGIDY
jgi:hypothetical protein